MNELVEKASILVEALPYIRTFAGKTVVIKYGGSAMQDKKLRRAVALDVILLKYVGLNPVIVHGGGPEINQYMKQLGKEAQFVNGLRVTDAETMEVVQMVLAGKLNKVIVSLINRLGGKAVGISGIDADLFVARKYFPRQMEREDGEGGMDSGPVDLGYVGEIERVNPEVVELLAKSGYIPVISPVAVGLQGESYNVNADTAAGELAIALGADKLILLTDVEGIYEDPEDPDSLISALEVQRARKLIKEGRIKSGMIPKVQACIECLERGVPRTHIIDGRQLHSLLLEIFTDRGIGTMVVS